MTAPPKGRRFKPGEENFQAILTQELVNKMRRLQKSGWSYSQLSEEFGVDRKHAWRICNNQAWITNEVLS